MFHKNIIETEPMQTTTLEAQRTRSQYELERGKPLPSKNHSKIEARCHSH